MYFNYYGNGQLHNITTGGLVWSYTYSGSNLATVTDPQGRVTTYSYFTGSNAWLIKEIAYPTGAGTKYTYDNAPVSAGVTTYYVTLQNTNTSSTVLDKSTQFNYKITNGAINYCNTTITDGTGTNQSRINYVFGSAQTQVNEFANKTIILQYQNEFSSAGEINESKILSPINSLLAYSTMRYDNWGNEIYTNNTIGQQTWFSYGNTNTTNAFYNIKDPVTQLWVQFLYEQHY